MFTTKEDVDIRDLAGTEMALHYPDRGILHASEFFRAGLHFEPSREESGWMRRFEVRSQSFSTVLSSDAEGLRIFVPSYQYSLYIPWAEATCSAERWGNQVIVRITTHEVPTPKIVLSLSEAAAELLFVKVIPGLNDPSTMPHARIDPLQAALWAVLIVIAISTFIGFWIAL